MLIIFRVWQFDVMDDMNVFILLVSNSVHSKMKSSSKLYKPQFPGLGEI